MCDPLTINCRIYPRQLLFIELIERQPDRVDGVEQIAVALQASLGGDGCVLCTDELEIFQLAHILADDAGAHTHRIADGLVAGPALVGISVLTAKQVRRRSAHRVTGPAGISRWVVEGGSWLDRAWAIMCTSIRTSRSMPRHPLHEFLLGYHHPAVDFQRREKGGPNTNAQRLRGERRSNEVNESCRLRRGE